MKKLAILTLSVAMASVAVASPEIGKPAPAFTLKDTSGKEHSLADFKGKLVVLEWVNHGCPFVKKHYEPGNMQKIQAEAVADGAVWLSICSSAPGKQGHMSAEDAAAKSKDVESKATAYLLDEDGTVGKAYDARTTPEIFIINPEGLLVYKGAIDDKPSASSADIEGAVNHVTVALKEIADGKPVTVSATKPYGCSVKYAAD
ncbi:MAG: thioredoxin family protein [Terrimicrobiaceae bacterium]